MSAAGVMGRIAEASPRSKARMAAALYFFSLLTAASGELLLHGRLGIAAGLVAVVSMMALTLLFYDIFKVVNRSVCLLAAFSNLVGLCFEAVRWNPRGVDIALVFDGVFCILIGYLILRSIFMPRILGVLMVIAGLGWVTYLSPVLAHEESPYNLASGLLGEGLVMLWLLVMGVNAERWREQADGARVRLR